MQQDRFGIALEDRGNIRQIDRFMPGFQLVGSEAFDEPAQAKTVEIERLRADAVAFQHVHYCPPRRTIEDAYLAVTVAPDGALLRADPPPILPASASNAAFPLDAQGLRVPALAPRGARPGRPLGGTSPP